MKYLLCLVFAICGRLAVAQIAPVVSADASGRSELVYVVAADGSQDALFGRAKGWVFTAYKSGKTVEQFEDKAAGHILIKALTGPVIRNGTDRGGFTYDLSIDVKEGKARFAVNNLVYRPGAMLVEPGANLAESYPSNWPTIRKKSFQAAWEQIQADTKADLIRLASSFEAALNTKPKDF